MHISHAQNDIPVSMFRFGAALLLAAAMNSVPASAASLGGSTAGNSLGSSAGATHVKPLPHPPIKCPTNTVCTAKGPVQETTNLGGGVQANPHPPIKCPTNTVCTITVPVHETTNLGPH